MGVKDVVANARALDGQEIEVQGWIEECHRLSCPLYASAEEVGKDWPYLLSVGSSRWFDAFAADNAPTQVTLRARLRDRCINDPAKGIISVCADRANTLEPIRLLQ
ncbi:MAG TPA: hypothetical protein VGW34_02295 [Allosphingosinicella sp.]|nr:hypothetical protein [Allosphingosinicella sp.]